MILRERLSAKAIAYRRTSPFVIGAVEHKENESASRYILCRAPQEAQGSQAKKDAAAEMAFKRRGTVDKEFGQLSQNRTPGSSTHAWGSGEFVAARLLTGQQGASGDGGCCPVGQCVFDEDFLLGKQLHLGMRRSVRLTARGDRANFAPQYFPSPAPLVPY
jgi:hypothetical protein